MRIPSIALAALLLVATPAWAEDAAPPSLSKGQMDALKKGLDASPQTPGRAAMMAKLLKLAMAMKKKEKVSAAEVLPLLAYLREAQAGKKADPAFEGAMQQLEHGITQIQGSGNNEDMNELRKEFEGYEGD